MVADIDSDSDLDIVSLDNSDWDGTPANARIVLYENVDGTGLFAEAQKVGNVLIDVIDLPNWAPGLQVDDFDLDGD